MRVEMDLEALLDLYRHASLGKLINGLIHNLNGPLQNIGMDLEMMLYSLSKGGPEGGDSGENPGRRLERMEEELNRMGHLIRTALTRGGVDGDLDSPRDLNEFCEQELDFLESNLYFKHHVRKALELEDPLPQPDGFGRRILDALGWLLRGVVAEMERQRAEHLLLKTCVAGSAVEMVVSTGGRPLSPEFLECLNTDTASAGLIKIREADPGVRLAAATLKAQGVSLTLWAEGSAARITLTFPSGLSG